MRSYDDLEDLQNAHKLQLWLYSNPDESISVENALGVKLNVSINDDFSISAKTENGYNVIGEFNLMDWVNIASQISKEQPELWDKIKFDNAAASALSPKP